jgi:hypothetical protein
VRWDLHSFWRGCQIVVEQSLPRGPAAPQASRAVVTSRLHAPQLVLRP